MDIASLYHVSSGAVREAVKQTGAMKNAEAAKEGQDIFSTMLHTAIDNIHTTNSYISDMENEELKQRIPMTFQLQCKKHRKHCNIQWQ